LVTPSTPPPSEEDLQSAAVVPPQAPARDPAWGILEVLALVPASVMLTLLLSVIFLVPVMVWMLAHGTLTPGEKPPLTIFARAALPAQGLAYLLLIGTVKLVLAKRGSRDLLKALHWNWPSPRSAAGLSILGIAVALIASAVSAHMQVPPNAPILEMLKDKVVAAMFVVFGIAIAPFTEEFYFRGLLYPALQRNIGTTASVLITSVFFALIHASQLANSLGPVSILLIIGLLLTIIRARTDSVAASVVFHVAYNSTLFMVGAFT
jgi:membrane protease YdiL (CAAX protease family)